MSQIPANNLVSKTQEKAAHRRSIEWGTTRQLLKTFFLNYVWLGVVLILGAILVERSYAQNLSFQMAAFCELTKTIGVSIFVAAIFSFAAGTTDFMNRISDLLQNIVVNRRFLKNMDVEAKKDILYAILQPSDFERIVYGNVDDYYRNYINRTMQVSKKCVRSNYNFECRVRFDQVTKRVIADYVATYRLYPSIEGYDDIKIGYYGEGSEALEFQKVIVYAPDGKVFESDRIKLDSLQCDEKPTGESIRRLPVKEFGRNYPHLDIEFRSREIGEDHWICPGFQALQPTDGFRFHIVCDDPLCIREEQTFVFGAHWHKNPAEARGKRELTISCQQWIDEGAGVTVVVAIPHPLDESLLKDSFFRVPVESGVAVSVPTAASDFVKQIAR